MCLPPIMKLVAGLDLARRRDHSALVLLDVEPDRLTVTRGAAPAAGAVAPAVRLIAPHLAGLDLLVFDQSGLGDAAAELAETPPHIGVCLSAAIARSPARKETAWSSASRG